MFSRYPYSAEHFARRHAYVELGFFTTTRHARRARRGTMFDYERRFKDTTMKMIATETLVRKVRTGDLQVKLLYKLMTPMEKIEKISKDFVRQLELFARIAGPQNLEDEFSSPIETLDIAEDLKKILLFNRKKQIESIQRETRLLMDVVFGKKITSEHNEQLRKEFHRNKKLRRL